MRRTIADIRTRVGRRRLLRYSTDVIVVALIIFVPVALFAAMLAMMALAHFRLIPAGVSGLVTYSLVCTVCLGTLFLWLTMDDLVLRTARLQKELVGQQLGSPLQLRRYETYGFQDPHYEWHYAVSPEMLRQLRRRCRTAPRMPATYCVIAEQRDGSWRQGIGLDGEILWVIGSDS